jgi:hypothetical protein
LALRSGQTTTVAGTPMGKPSNFYFIIFFLLWGGRTTPFGHPRLAKGVTPLLFLKKIIILLFLINF